MTQEDPGAPGTAVLPHRRSAPNILTKSMKRRPSILLVGIALLAVSLGLVRSAQATLGESADSVVSDRKALSAAAGRSAVLAGYTVQEIVSGAATIREYLSPDNIVFAIAWNGLSNPDLTRLLGPYAREYHQALQKTSRERGRRHQRIKTNRLVVEKWGHMRNLQGRAFVPKLIPPGVNVDDIR